MMTTITAYKGAIFTVYYCSFADGRMVPIFTLSSDKADALIGFLTSKYQSEFDEELC